MKQKNTTNIVIHRCILVMIIHYRDAVQVTLPSPPSEYGAIKEIKVGGVHTHSGSHDCTCIHCTCIPETMSTKKSLVSNKN